MTMVEWWIERNLKVVIIMTMSKENSNVHVLENFVSSLKHACMHELGNFSKLNYINKMLSLLNKEKRI